MIPAIGIYIVLPLAGLTYFLFLKKRIERQTPSAPIPAIFILFATYGGLLQVVLTSLLRLSWSGMASLGTFYLIIAAPVVMLVIAYANYGKRQSSSYHNLCFLAAASYIIIAPIVFALIGLLSKQ